MRLNLNKAGMMYICVLGVFLVLAIKGIKDGKIFGIDNSVFMVYIVFTRVVYLVLHELSHVFALKSRHLKIREFKIYGLRYIGVTRKFEFSIKEFDFSGYVIPWLIYDIDTDVSFLKFKSTYIVSLLAGPIFPFVICFVICFVGEMFSLPFEVFTLTFFINAVLMLLSSFTGNKGGMGDIQAIIYFFNDRNFALQLLEDLPMLKEHVSEKEWKYLNEKTLV